MLKLKPLIAAKAKENQRGGQGGVLLSQNSAKANLTLSPGRGKKGCQNSDNLIETRKELSKLAGVSLLEDRPESSFQMIPESLAGSFG